MCWIDVKEELPSEGVRVLVIDEENDIWIMVYDKYDGWECPQEGWTMNVTHWMSLPDKPNKN